MKKILFVSSEAVPYIKTGGLADVVGSLPKYFNRKEYDVRVILPKYACMDAAFLPGLHFVCHFYDTSFLFFRVSSAPGRHQTADYHHPHLFLFPRQVHLP